MILRKYLFNDCDSFKPNTETNDQILFDHLFCYDIYAEQKIKT